MLIELNNKKGNIISIKLVTGEELVARFEEETDTDITVDKPMSLQIGPQGVGITQFMLTMDMNSKVTISKHNCLVIATTRKEMSDQYIQGTTGLAMPS
jgi:hypothetical protein|tara:strand:+ start:319 stop:612 length:294 start_codon:yes stop_codon:yes gene_type:complete